MCISTLLMACDDVRRQRLPRPRCYEQRIRFWVRHDRRQRKQSRPPRPELAKAGQRAIERVKITELLAPGLSMIDEMRGHHEKPLHVLVESERHVRLLVL